MMILIKKSGFLLIILLVMLTVLFSGCTGGQDVTSVVKALPEVQQFMKEHPNAKITVTYWSKEEVAQSEQKISQQCDKPIASTAMYKATVSEGDLKFVSWINAENQIVVCSITEGSQSDTPTQSPTPTSTYTVTSTPTITPTYTNPTQTPTPTATSDMGYIYVWSNPAGGGIYVDGNYKGTTDGSQYVIISTTTGYHTVEISKTGYEKYSESVYVSYQYATVKAYLSSISTPTPTPTSTFTPDVGYIYVWSNPAGGSIYVDGNYNGTTDSSQYVVISTTIGYHTVEISKTGYEKYSESVYVSYSQYATVNAYFTPTSTPTPTPTPTATPTPTPTPTATPDIGYIYVWSSPTGGSIYVDGNYKGTTESSQYVIISITTGYHTVEISKTGYEKYSTSVYVAYGQGTTVTANLILTPTPTPTPTPTQTPFGYIGVASDPPLSYIYIDGHYKGVTLNGSLQVFAVSVGRHRVVLMNGDLYWESNSVDVDSPNTRTDVVVTKSMWW